METANEYIIQALKANKTALDICARCLDKVTTKVSKLHAVTLLYAVGGIFVYRALNTQQKRIEKLEEQMKKEGE